MFKLLRSVLELIVIYLFSDDGKYKFPSTAPRSQETHGGDDVGIFGIGPWAHLLTGVHEQHLIPHIMAYASCIGDGLKYCDFYRYVK